jgi:hypothetical protein
MALISVASKTLWKDLNGTRVASGNRNLAAFSL